MGEQRLNQTVRGDCARGCLLHNRHTPNCTCTPECPDHTNHCEGCAPKPAETGHYCHRCTEKFRTALVEIPDLAAHLYGMPNQQLATRGHDQATADRTATKVDQISPSPVMDELDEVQQWAYRWALTVADTSADTGPFHYRIDGVPVTSYLSTNIRYLSNRLTRILTDDYHTDLYEETLRWRHRLELITGRDRLEHRIKDPCPSCGQCTLLREDGAAKVICRNNNCNRVWTEAEYSYLARVAAS